MNGDGQVSADDAPRGERERLLVDALEEYRTARFAGCKLDREELMQRYAPVAKELADCLDGIDLVQDVATQIRSPNVTRSVLPSQTLGDFSILREIGRGGMGVVYEAEQLSLGRAVALKVLPFAAMLDEKQLQRFKNEAKAAATLNHPNIVPVHFVGTERSVHFYAMQLIDGLSLADIIDATQKKLSKSVQDPKVGPTAETQPIAKLSTAYSSDPCKYFETVADIGCHIARGAQPRPSGRSHPSRYKTRKHFGGQRWQTLGDGLRPSSYGFRCQHDGEWRCLGNRQVHEPGASEWRTAAG